MRSLLSDPTAGTPETTVVGRFRAPNLEVAKPIMSSRIKVLANPPAFDLPSLYDSSIATAFEKPSCLPLKPPYPTPSRVRVRGDKDGIFDFYRRLDASGGLQLLPCTATRPEDRSGLLAVHKDVDRDRMILDARPPNRRERALKSWTFLMASASTLCHIQIPADKVIAG